MDRTTKALFLVILLVSFFDWMSLGFVYPLFSAMLYQPDMAFLKPEASDALRGMWLGILIGTTPFMNFIFSPVIGMISDQQGRRRVLIITLIMSLLGSMTALAGIFASNLYIIGFSRILVGIGASNGGVLRAIVTDISLPGQKGKNFGLLNMFSGIGYAAGPSLGVIAQNLPIFHLSPYTKPFIVATIFALFNFLFLYFFLKETYIHRMGGPAPSMFSVKEIKQSFRLKGLGMMLLAIFIACFGWAYYWGFLPVTWIHDLHLSNKNVGEFYTLAWASYALCSGLFIRPLFDRFGEGKMLILSTLGLSLCLFYSFFHSSYHSFWVLLPVQQFFLAIYYSSSPTVISDMVSPTKQGQAMGIATAMKSLGFSLSPILSGALISFGTTVPMIVGGTLLMVATLILVKRYGTRLWNLHPR